MKGEDGTDPNISLTLISNIGPFPIKNTAGKAVF